LTWFVVALGVTYLARYFMQADEPLNAINLNILNLSFLMLGFILHGTPARMMRAFQDATPAVWGVILQFPFYGSSRPPISARRSRTSSSRSLRCQSSGCSSSGLATSWATR